MDGSSYRIEAERWLTIAEKLISTRDFQGAKTFAIRARESDPRLLEFADQIIAVADTIIAGELRVPSYNGGGSLDYYAILQLPRLSQSLELIVTQYRKLALLLNPTRNRLSFADHAFRLISEAWMVFSDPSKKAMYDNELQVSQLGQLGQLGQFPQMAMPAQEFPLGQTSQGNDQRSPSYSLGNRIQTPFKVTQPVRPIAQHVAPEPTRPVAQPRSVDPGPVPVPVRPQPQANLAEPVRPTPQPQSKPTATESNRSTAQPNVVAEPSRPISTESNRPATQSSDAIRAIRSVTEPKVPSFWTACPYCYILYEYPKGYEDCALRCQKCKSAFHAAVIPSPPVGSNDTYFCSWGFFPLGFTARGKGGGGFGVNWSPITAIFGTPARKANPRKRPAAKVIYDDDDYINLSDSSGDEESSDDDWDGKDGKRKKVKSTKGKQMPSKNVKRSLSERSKKAIMQNGVSGGNEGEASSGKKRGAKDLGKLDLNVMFSNEGEEAGPRVNASNRAGNGEDDNIEGIGFFEGLDEFLSSLPILSVVGDDKVKAS